MSSHSTNNFYNILGVPATASQDDIKKAYHKKVKDAHPDKNPGYEKQANKRFQKIQQAYEILSDSKKRAEYDRGNLGEFTDDAIMNDLVFQLLRSLTKEQMLLICSAVLFLEKRDAILAALVITAPNLCEAIQKLDAKKKERIFELLFAHLAF
mmetsp:Transcript_27567/g.47199  ORF Transcript_27567/g.47199 Transcript_27567/m.47199 type:complete len:153 (+) Transcript_27567:513-971(+)